MKNSKATVSLMVLFLTSFTAFSFSDPEESKATEKARKAVHSAAPYDWRILAQSAEVCFKKNENIEEALEWIQRSLELYEDPYNLEIMGDYLSSRGENREATGYYYKAIVKGKEQNFWFNTDRLQQKIWDLR